MLLPMPFIQPLSTTAARSAWTATVPTEGEPEQTEEEEEGQRDKEDPEREEVAIAPIDDDRVPGIDRVALVIDDLDDFDPAIIRTPILVWSPDGDSSNRSDQDEKQSCKNPLAFHYTDTFARNGGLNDGRLDSWNSDR